MAKLRKKTSGSETNYWPTDDIIKFEVGSKDSLDCSVTYQIDEHLQIEIATETMLRFLQGYTTAPHQPITEFEYAENAWIRIIPLPEGKSTGMYKHDKALWWKEKIIPWMRAKNFPMELTAALCEAGAEKLKGRKRVAVPHFSGAPLKSSIYVALKEMVVDAESEKESEQEEQD